MNLYIKILYVEYLKWYIMAGIILGKEDWDYFPAT